MSVLATAGLTIFTLLMFIGLMSIASGLPGTLIILGAALIYAVVTGFGTVGLKVLAALAALAIVSEFLDVLFIMKGSRGSGFSKAGAVSSIVGGLAGAAVLTPVLMGLGAFMGVLIGGIGANLLVDISNQRGRKAFTYRDVFGSAARKVVKGVCGIAMVLIVLSAIYS